MVLSFPFFKLHVGGGDTFPLLIGDPASPTLGMKCLNKIKASIRSMYRHRHPTQTPRLPSSYLHNKFGKEQFPETFSSHFGSPSWSGCSWISILWITFSPDCFSPNSFLLGEPKDLSV